MVWAEAAATPSSSISNAATTMARRFMASLYTLGRRTAPSAASLTHDDRPAHGLGQARQVFPPGHGAGAERGQMRGRHLDVEQRQPDPAGVLDQRHQGDLGGVAGAMEHGLG